MMAKDLMKWWGASGKPYRTISGVPPLMFIANGQPLKYWSISGNSGGVGDRTKNLLIEEYIQGNAISTSIIRVKNKTSIPVYAGENYTVAFNTDVYNVALASSPTANYPFAVDTLTHCGQSTAWLNSTYTFNCTNDGFICVQIRKKDNTNIVPSDVDSKIQFEKGSNATAYEPYGYRIPVTCGGTTTNIYLNAPLGEGETVTLAETGIEIPTLDGTNILSIGTTVQPSEVYIKGRIKEVRECESE